MFFFEPSSCIRTNMAHPVAQFEGSRIRYDRTFFRAKFLQSQKYALVTSYFEDDSINDKQARMEVPFL